MTDMKDVGRVNGASWRRKAARWPASPWAEFICLALLLAITFVAIGTAAYADTPWQAVPYTSTVERVVSDAGFVTRVEAEAAVGEALDQVRPAPLAINTRGPSGTVVTNEFVLPTASTRYLVFDTPEFTGDPTDAITGVSFSGQRLHTMVIDRIPEGLDYVLLSMDVLAVSNRLVNVPAWDDVSGWTEGAHTNAWVLTANDVPAVLVVQELREGLVLLRLERSGQANQ